MLEVLQILNRAATAARNGDIDACEYAFDEINLLNLPSEEHLEAGRILYHLCLIADA